MKNKLLAFLVSRIGGIITPIIAVAIAAVVAKLSAFDPTLAETIDQTAVVSFVVALVISIANSYIYSNSTKGVKSIQALMNVKQDGVAGPVTYTEVRRAVAVKKPQKPKK